MENNEELNSVLIKKFKKDKRTTGYLFKIPNNRKGFLTPKEWGGEDLDEGDILKVKLGAYNEDKKNYVLTIFDQNQKPRPEWWDLSESFFSDSTREINVSLITCFAERVSTSCKNGLSKNALRNFYDEVKRIENQIHEGGENFDPENEFKKRLPQIKLLKAKAAHNYYSKAKEFALPFKRFIDDSVDMIKEYKDFQAFALVFEALAGYHSRFAK